MTVRLSLCLVLFAAPAFAQPPHADVVAQVKSILQAQGVSLADSCGAFQITKRVAWTLRGEGAGTLDKPSGNQCEGRAVDIIIYPDGHAFDILTDAGGSNGPSWSPIAPVDAARWRAPADPGDTAAPPPVVMPPAPPPPAPVPASWLTPEWLQSYADQIVTRTTNAITLSHDDLTNQHHDQAAALKAAIDSPAWYNHLWNFVSDPRVAPILAGAFTYVFTKKAMQP